MNTHKCSTALLSPVKTRPQPPAPLPYPMVLVLNALVRPIAAQLLVSRASSMECKRPSCEIIWVARTRSEDEVRRLAEVWRCEGPLQKVTQAPSGSSNRCSPSLQSAQAPFRYHGTPLARAQLLVQSRYQHTLKVLKHPPGTSTLSRTQAHSRYQQTLSTQVHSCHPAYFKVPQRASGTEGNSS